MSFQDLLFPIVHLLRAIALRLAVPKQNARSFWEFSSQVVLIGRASLLSGASRAANVHNMLDVSDHLPHGRRAA